MTAACAEDVHLRAPRFVLSGLWHHQQRSGQPLRKTVVRIPGPSWSEYRWMSKTRPVRLARSVRPGDLRGHRCGEPPAHHQPRAPRVQWQVPRGRGRCGGRHQGRNATSDSRIPEVPAARHRGTGGLPEAADAGVGQSPIPGRMRREPADAAGSLVAYSGSAITAGRGSPGWRRTRRAGSRSRRTSRRWSASGARSGTAVSWSMTACSQAFIVVASGPTVSEVPSSVYGPL